MKERLTKRIDNKTYFIIKTEGNDFYSDGFYSDGEDLTFNYYDKEVQKKLDRLAEYEDLEEQGLIVRLPCKVGDIVYLIGSSYLNEPIRTGRVTSVELFIYDNGYDPYWMIGTENPDTGESQGESMVSNSITNVFSTRLEAEKKLAELRGKSDEYNRR